MSDPARAREDVAERARRLRAGDREALHDALAELLPDVRRWLHRALGPGAPLDDVTQDVLIELARALRTFEGRSSLRTLAYRVTVRHGYRGLAKHRQRRERERPLELLPPPPDRIDPESRAMHREALARLYRCLERMPEKRRRAFVLCAIEGLTPQEAAELEGTKPVTMRSRLHHARQEVERRLSGDPYVSRLLEGRGA